MNIYKVKKSIYKTILLIFLFCFCSAFSQQEINRIVLPDSLLAKSYDELRKGYYELKSNKNDHEIYALSYLKKAKIARDTFRIAVGYHFIAHYNLNNHDEIVVRYTDSIIQITKNKNFKKYPIAAYIINGDLYYRKRNFKKSFDNYMKAKEYVGSTDKKDFINYHVDHQIGGIKARLLLNEEALKIFQKSWKFVVENDYYTKNKQMYIQALSDLSLLYVRNNKLDSATILNKIGIRESIETHNYYKYNILVLNEGINLHLQKNNTQAYDSLKKAIKYFEDKKKYTEMAFGYYYLGNIFRQDKDYSKMLFFLKNVDTIFQKTNDLHPQLRNGYEVLINYYKSIDDKKNTLVYIEKLMKVDSVLNSNFKYLSAKIIKEYETPELLNEKDKIIKSVNNKNKNYLNIGVLLLCLIIIMSSILSYNIRKQKFFKKQFLKLLEKTQNDDTNLVKKTVEFNSRKVNSIGISKVIIDNILNQLDDFEKNKEYLEQGITINSLSKRIQTNTKYLSLIVNNYKEQTFTLYINKLRIEYAVNKIKNDLVFRKYTIKAIANEVGFNSAESFSTAFYKETNLKPSYFLKNIENLHLD